jgi:hypothetical protein
VCGQARRFTTILTTQVLAGVKATLRNEQGVAVSTVTTSSTGNYCLVTVTAGAAQATTFITLAFRPGMALHDMPAHPAPLAGQAGTLHHLQPSSSSGSHAALLTVDVLLHWLCVPWAAGIFTLSFTPPAGYTQQTATPARVVLLESSSPVLRSNQHVGFRQG